MMKSVLVAVTLPLALVSCDQIFPKEKNNIGPRFSLNLDKEIAEPLSKDEECALFKGILDDDKDFSYSFISVPTDPDSASGRKINVFYYHRAVEDADATPVIFFNGGPSGDSHSSYQAMKDRISDTNHPWVFIDQRGTGCSDSYPEIEKDAEFADLAKWGSTGIISDAEQIRKELYGDKKWKVFGQSYGALIGHRYVELYPDSLHSVHAHGYAQLESNYEWKKERHLSQKYVLDEYLKKFPSDRIRFDSIAKHLDSGACYTYKEEEICGREAFDPMSIYLGFTLRWEEIHEVLGIIVESDGTIDHEKLGRLVGILSFAGDDGGYENLGGVAISFSEMNTSDFDKNDVTHCRRVVEDLENLGQPHSSWLLSECRTKMTDYEEDTIEAFAILRDTIARNPLNLKKIKSNLKEREDLKFYLYSGRLDTLVPPGTFKEEIALFGDLIEYKEFEGSGHGGFYTEDLVWENLAK